MKLDLLPVLVDLAGMTIILPPPDGTATALWSLAEDRWVLLFPESTGRPRMYLAGCDHVEAVVTVPYAACTALANLGLADEVLEHPDRRRRIITCGRWRVTEATADDPGHVEYRMPNSDTGMDWPILPRPATWPAIAGYRPAYPTAALDLAGLGPGWHHWPRPVEPGAPAGAVRPLDEARYVAVLPNPSGGWSVGVGRYEMVAEHLDDLWDYETEDDALHAATVWNGHGEPVGWRWHPGSCRDGLDLADTAETIAAIGLAGGDATVALVQAIAGRVLEHIEAGHTVRIAAGAGTAHCDTCEHDL